MLSMSTLLKKGVPAGWDMVGTAMVSHSETIPCSQGGQDGPGLRVHSLSLWGVFDPGVLNIDRKFHDGEDQHPTPLLSSLQDGD